MGRRKIEIKAIKDDRNRSVYVIARHLPHGSPQSPISQTSLLLTRGLQNFSKAKRRLVQEGTRALCALFCRCRRLHLRQQQEALRVLFD